MHPSRPQARPAPLPPPVGADQLLQQQYGQSLMGMPQLLAPLQLQPFAGVQGGALNKRCACKKARCLKLYCVCFAAGKRGGLASLHRPGTQQPVPVRPPAAAAQRLACCWRAFEPQPPPIATRRTLARAAGTPGPAPCNQAHCVHRA